MDVSSLFYLGHKPIHEHCLQCMMLTYSFQSIFMLIYFLNPVGIRAISGHFGLQSFAKNNHNVWAVANLSDVGCVYAAFLAMKGDT